MWQKSRATGWCYLPLDLLNNTLYQTGLLYFCKLFYHFMMMMNSQPKGKSLAFCHSFMHAFIRRTHTVPLQDNLLQFLEVDLNLIPPSPILVIKNLWMR